MLSFSVGNIEIHIQSLSSALDEAFVQFYSSRLGNSVLQQSMFDDAASAFLRSTPDPGQQDKYFSNFTPLWNLHLRAGNLRDAAAVWLRFLPALLWVKTYRYRKHVGPEYDWDMGYRSREEVEEAMRMDPVAKARRDLVADGKASMIQILEQTVQQQVAAALEKAEAAPWPEAV